MFVAESGNPCNVEVSALNSGPNTGDAMSDTRCSRARITDSTTGVTSVCSTLLLLRVGVVGISSSHFRLRPAAFYTNGNVLLINDFTHENHYSMCNSVSP